MSATQPEKLIKKAEQREKRKIGGKREGAGRPAGSLSLKTRTLLEVKNRIAQKADDILNAELLEALGSFVVMKADPETLEYRQVTDEDEIVRFIQEHKGANGRMGDSVYIITAKQGNYKSRQYLFDRAFGRPAQSVEVTTDPELARLKSMIDACARENGTTYEDELRIYLDQFADKFGVQPDIKAKLTSELVQ